LSDAGGDVDARSCWCLRSRISRRPIFGDYAALLTDIKSNDFKAYQSSCRIRPDDYGDYDELLHPSPTRIQTVKAASPEADERIFMNVRHVAKTRDRLCILQKHVAVSVDMSKAIEHVSLKHATCQNTRQCGRRFTFKSMFVRSIIIINQALI